MNSNYAVMGSRGLISKILIPFDEAKEFKKNSLDKNAVIIKFGWHKIKDISEVKSE